VDWEFVEAMSETAQMLADSLRRLFSDHGRVSSAQPVAEMSLWLQCKELGLDLVLVPEAQGGVGGTWQDAVIALHEAGYFQVPLPLAEGILSARILSDWGLPAPHEPVSLCTKVWGTLRSNDSQPRFSGELHGVPWGRDCTVVAVIENAGVLTGMVLERPPGRILRHTNLAGEPRDLLLYEDCPATALPCESPESRHLLDYCALARSAQAAGCLESALAQTVKFATERVQFGRPIGQFQAIQQQIAVCGAEVAAVIAAVRAAAKAADSGEASFQIACAKLRANRAIGICTGIFHQVHGAIGFTQEHSLHHATQRLWSWRSEYGNDGYWSERIGAQVAGRGSERFWSDLTSRDDRALSE
jgi:acyl-CoA dehydrogenase